MLTDQGIIEGVAHELLLYRKHLSAQKQVRILADIMVKHAYPLGIGQTIEATAKDTVHRALADGIIVSGTATGCAPDLIDLENAREAVSGTPIFVGSGACKDNLQSLLSIADGAIVASSLKRQGILENPVDVERVRALISTLKSSAKANKVDSPAIT